MNDISNSESGPYRVAQQVVQDVGGEVRVEAGSYVLRVGSVEIESRPLAKGQVVAGHDMRVRINGQAVPVRGASFHFTVEGLPYLSLNLVPIHPCSENEALRDRIEALERQLAEERMK